MLNNNNEGVIPLATSGGSRFPAAVMLSSEMSPEQRLERYRFLRRQVLSELEQRIHNMVDRLGEEFFQFQPRPVGSLGRVHTNEALRR